jgi:hypothetical protein
MTKCELVVTNHDGNRRTTRTCDYPTINKSCDGLFPAKRSRSDGGWIPVGEETYRSASTGFMDTGAPVGSSNCCIRTIYGITAHWHSGIH